MNISLLQPLNAKYMRVAYVAIITSILLLAAIGPSLLAAASDDPDNDETTCLGTITGDVDGDVVVPSGVICTITTGVTVDGDIEVEPGGALGVEPGATVHGDVTANQPEGLIPAPLGLEAIQIGLPFPLSQAAGIPPVTIMGDVVIVGSTGSISITNSIIGGDVVIRDMPFVPGSRIGISGSVIDGHVIIEDNEVECVCALARNNVGGDVQVNNNIDFNVAFVPLVLDIDIIGNTIDGDLECEGNLPAPDIINPFTPPSVDPINTVAGDAEGQCAGLAIDGGDDNDSDSDSS